MGIRGELFTKQITAENRTYFFNVKENTRGDVFLQVVESKASEGVGFDRHAIVVFEDEMRTFLQGLDKCLEFIEKNRKEKVKSKKISKTKKAKLNLKSGSDFGKKNKQNGKTSLEFGKVPKRKKIIKKTRP